MRCSFSVALRPTAPRHRPACSLALLGALAALTLAAGCGQKGPLTLPAAAPAASAPAR